MLFSKTMCFKKQLELRHKCYNSNCTNFFKKNLYFQFLLLDYKTTLEFLQPCFLIKIPFSGLFTFTPCKL